MDAQEKAELQKPLNTGEQIVKYTTTDEQIAKLEAISDPNKNEIRINRDRVGNWRVSIDEHLTDLYAGGRNPVLALAIQEALNNYQNYAKEKAKNLLP